MRSLNHVASPEEARFIYDEIYTQRLYTQAGVTLQPGIQALCLVVIAVVHVGMTVLDVGANIGLFTLFAARCGL